MGLYILITLPPPTGSGAVLQSYHSNDKNLTLSFVFCIFCLEGTLAPIHLYILYIFLQSTSSVATLTRT
jgi:hypothetical protein